MEEPFLRDYPDIIDIRPIHNDVSFQSPLRKYTCNANMHMYTGMTEEDIKQIRKHLEDTTPSDEKIKEYEKKKLVKKIN